jgi:hypothetical protein
MLYSFVFFLIAVSGSPIAVIASQQEVELEFERLHILDEEDEEADEAGEEDDDECPPPVPFQTPQPAAQCNEQRSSSCSSEDRSTEEEFADATSDSQNNNVV